MRATKIAPGTSLWVIKQDGSDVYGPYLSEAFVAGVDEATAIGNLTRFVAIVQWPFGFAEIPTRVFLDSDRLEVTKVGEVLTKGLKAKSGVITFQVRE